MVYSYIRFSTPEQDLGDSERRQLEKAREFCRKKNLTLEDDATFYDRGTSGFRGKQRREGALREFLDLVESGEVKEGSFLLIEEIDRLSREEPNEAQRLILNLFDAGISIVTLSDGQIYSPDERNLGKTFLLIGKIFQAYDESQKKSSRLKDSWKAKRQKKEILTAQTPNWLTVEDGKFHVIEERAKIIRQIFAWCLEGCGNKVIAEKLNSQNIKPWSRGERKPKQWHSSYVQRILSNRAVIGEFQPHEVTYTKIKENGVKSFKRKRVPAGEPIQNYFPRVIEPAIFLKAQSERKDREIKKSGRTSNKVTNLFSKIAFCGYCGNSMHFVDKSTPDYPDYKYLACSRRCSKTTWRYDEFETAFLNFINQIDFSVIFASDKSKLSALEAKKFSKKDELAQIAKKAERLISLIEEGKAPAKVLNRLNELEDREQALKREIEAIQQQIESASSRESENAEKIVKELARKKKDTDARRRLMVEFRRRIEKITVCGGGFVDLERNQKGYLDIEAAYLNGKIINGPQYSPQEYARKVKALKQNKAERFFRVTFKNGATRYVFPACSWNDGKPFIADIETIKEVVS